jgi:hypothetical protein
MFIMGTSFVLMATLKLATMGGVGIALASAFQFFHTFEFKTSKGKKGGDDNGVGESLRKKSESIGKL